MTDKKTEALKLALEALRKAHPISNSDKDLYKHSDALTAIREALAEQPAQLDPVMDWTPCIKLPVVVHVRKQRPGEKHVSTREGITPVKPDDLIMRGVSGEEYPIGRDIFEQTYSLETSTPASRPWVGLTDEERRSLREWQEIQKELGPVWAPMMLYLYEAIEAKLKEKNT